MMLRFSLLSASVILASVVMQPQVESKELSIERI